MVNNDDGGSGDIVTTAFCPVGMTISVKVIVGV